MITLPELSDKLSVAMVEEQHKQAASATRTLNELQHALLMAQQWWEHLFGNTADISKYVPDEHRPPLVELCNLLRLNFLAPSIQQAIIDGTQPSTMT